MGVITYDVAVSLDGFISGPDDDVSQFSFEGEHVDAYSERMRDYDAVVMGRKTYEYGYQHGLKPGQAPYPNMDHFVVSSTLQVPPTAAIERIAGDIAARVSELKTCYRSIYLCGGGELAGLLIDYDLVDRLCLKVAPVALRQGVKLFGSAQAPKAFVHLSTTTHSSGVSTMQYGRQEH